MNAENPTTVAASVATCPSDEGRARHGRVIRHPHQRPLVEGRECLHRADHQAPDGRLAPQDVAAPEHEEEADADAADDVEQHHADERADADRLVGRSHGVVAAGERFGNLDEVGDFRQPVARDHEPESIPALAEEGRRPLVGHRVIDAAAGPLLLALLDERERGQVDVPARGRIGFRAPPRVGGVERGSRRVFLQRFDEAVGPPIGGEPDQRLVGFAFSEVADAPGVGGVEPVAQHRRERGLAATLELDEGLGFAVERE